jgi:adenylosuccinate synthase
MSMDFNALRNTCVVGLQWGDEGKGKIVDLLTEHFDVVVRTGGGANAGHSVQFGDDKFALHLLPTGVLRPNVLSVIGPGVAVDLEILDGEIDALRARGIALGENLLISNRAHLVMPYHKKQDRLTDAAQGADTKIGTTAKGIGPCYADKMLRTSAFRVADLQRPDDFRHRLRRIVAERNTIFASLYGDAEPMDADKMADDALALAARLAVHVADTTPVLRDVQGAGRRILFEGAQGCLLDINHGTFPFVTSSTCTAGGVSAGAGVPPGCVHDTIGIIKGYTTRVGGGPFPTELRDATGDTIRRRGHEFGTTTGRPRRCGWFDAFAVRYAIDLSGVTQLAVMHLDTLGSLPEVRICTGYRYNDTNLPAFPADAQVLADVRPVYETLPGWEGNLRDVRDYDKLPAKARRYIDRLTELLGVPITLVSVGPDREATLHPTGKMKDPAPVCRPSATAGST